MAGVALPQIFDQPTPSPSAVARPGKSTAWGEPEDFGATAVGHHRVAQLLNAGANVNVQLCFVVSTRAIDRVRMISRTY